MSHIGLEYNGQSAISMVMHLIDMGCLVVYDISGEIGQNRAFIMTSGNLTPQQFATLRRVTDSLNSEKYRVSIDYQHDNQLEHFHNSDGNNVFNPDEMYSLVADLNSNLER